MRFDLVYSSLGRGRMNGWGVGIFATFSLWFSIWPSKKRGKVKRGMELPWNCPTRVKEGGKERPIENWLKRGKVALGRHLDGKDGSGLLVSERNDLEGDGSYLEGWAGCGLGVDEGSDLEDGVLAGERS